jgi:hypothetical protein
LAKVYERGYGSTAPSGPWTLAKVYKRENRDGGHEGEKQAILRIGTGAPKGPLTTFYDFAFQRGVLYSSGADRRARTRMCVSRSVRSKSTKRMRSTVCSSGSTW